MHPLSFVKTVMSKENIEERIFYLAKNCLTEEVSESSFVSYLHTRKNLKTSLCLKST